MSRAQFLAPLTSLLKPRGRTFRCRKRPRPSPALAAYRVAGTAIPRTTRACGSERYDRYVPLPLAREFEKAANIKILPVPLKLPRVDIKLLWHERYHDDPANRWLRGTMSRLFKDASWA